LLNKTENGVDVRPVLSDETRSGEVAHRLSGESKTVMETSMLKSNRWSRLPLSMNHYLIRLIIGALGPLLIFSIFMMILFARQEQANRRRGLEDTTRALALAIDQEIESSITNLEALATSEPLDVGAVNVFHAAAARILHTQNSWKKLTLFDPRGRALMNIAKPLVEDSGVISRESLNAVMKTRLPVISDFPSRNSREIGINIHVPVMREEKIIYILTAGIDPGVFTEILAQQKVSKEWVGTLFDAKRIIIARTREAKSYVGQPVGPLLAKTNALTSEQFVSGVTRDGVNAYAAISRSRRSGWYVALTVPSSDVNAILYRSVATVGGGGLLLLLLGLVVALVFARQASRSIAELSTAAHALGQGHAVAFPVASPIAELDELSHEMERAGQLLQERGKERDRVEAELREQEGYLQRHADLLNLANEAIFARELDGRIIYWNRGAEQLYGYSEKEVIGFMSQDLLATEFPSGRENFHAALIETGQWSGELKQTTKSGKRLEVESRFRLIEDRKGTRVILECNRDVSDRKRAARNLSTEHAVTLTLAESDAPETAWPKILEVIGTGLDWRLGALWLVNKENRLIECVEIWHEPAWNFAAQKERPKLSRGVGIAGQVWANEQPLWVSDLSKQAAGFVGAEVFHAAFAFPIKMRSEVLGVIELYDGVREFDEDLDRMVRAMGGEIGQFIERMRAEAALRQSEEHLRNQAQELEQQLLASGRLVAVGELTASMAHEFNNPLGIILGFAEGLLTTTDPSDARYPQVQIIVEETNRCERLVQELLEFGRPKCAEFAPTDVEEIIRKTIDLVRPHAGKNQVETIIQSDGQLPRIYADAQQLQQVLLNLSLNAVDAMPKGGTLTLGATVDSFNQMTITVADTGIGIDADVLPRIFQPFFTSKKRRGLGLGLPICDRIVKSHGGTIEVASKSGCGTTFKIHLFLKPPPADSQAMLAADLH
jgi:PAS domain S-box-containing protein